MLFKLSTTTKTKASPCFSLSVLFYLFLYISENCIAIQWRILFEFFVFGCLVVPPSLVALASHCPQ
jgi:hypothetical protein